MNLKEEIKKIWSECFDDKPAYVDMYFNRVYRDDDAVVLYPPAEGTSVPPASSLLLQTYPFRFHGFDLEMGYIAGAATRKQYRDRGYMAQLLHKALLESHTRGHLCCSLIPAHDWLYDYYGRHGFSTVFYVDPQRFTSLHSFPVEGEWTEVTDTSSDEVYEALADFERRRPCGVTHTRRDFDNILADLAMDHGRFVVVADADGAVCSMAWMTDDGSTVKVKELLGRDDMSCKAALHIARSHYPDRSFIVGASPLDVHRRLYPRGMSRIVNAELALQRVAECHPEWKCVLRIYDSLIAANTHTFICRDGQCTIDDTFEGKVDLAVDISVFTQIVFSSAAIGSILDFPSERPVMALMLD